MIADLSLLPLVIPFLFNSIQWVGATWHPTQDFATLEVRVRSVLTTHPPALGAFSRYGWSHPGPIWYWLLAPLYYLVGRQPWALVTGSGIVCASVLAIGWAYARRLEPHLGGPLFAATVLLPYLWLGPQRIQWPWNPYLAIPFLITALVGAVGTLREDLTGLAIMLVSFSVVLQLHIGYGTCALPVVVLCTALFAARARRSRTTWRQLLRGRSIRAAIAVVALMWIPPLVQEFSHYPGNLSRLATFVLHGDRTSGADKPGLRFAAKAMSAGFRSPQSLLGGTNERFTFAGWLLPRGGLSTALFVTVLAFVMVTALVTSRRSALGALATVAASFGFSATVNASQVTGELWSYLFDWRFIASSLLLVTLVATVWGALTPILHHSRVGPVPVAVALALLASSAVCGVEIHGLTALGRQVRTGENDGWVLVSHALDQVPRSGYIVVRDFGGNNHLGYGDELVNEADRRGLSVKVDPAVIRFGARKIGNPTGAKAIWLVSEDSVSTTLLLSLPGVQIVSLIDPLNAAQETRLRAVQLQIALRLGQLNETANIGALNSDNGWLFLRTVPGITSDDITLLANMARQIEQSGHCRCAIVTMNPNSAPGGVATAIRQLTPPKADY